MVPLVNAMIMLRVCFATKHYQQIGATTIKNIIILCIRVYRNGTANMIDCTYVNVSGICAYNSILVKLKHMQLDVM